VSVPDDKLLWLMAQWHQRASVTHELALANQHERELSLRYLREAMLIKAHIHELSVALGWEPAPTPDAVARSAGDSTSGTRAPDSEVLSSASLPARPEAREP
jgi:hypothetical protein